LKMQPNDRKSLPPNLTERNATVDQKKWGKDTFAKRAISRNLHQKEKAQQRAVKKATKLERFSKAKNSKKVAKLTSFEGGQGTIEGGIKAGKGKQNFARFDDKSNGQSV